MCEVFSGLGGGSVVLNHWHAQRQLIGRGVLWHAYDMSHFVFRGWYAVTVRMSSALRHSMIVAEQ